jgi:hypothetical protein
LESSSRLYNSIDKFVVVEDVCPLKKLKGSKISRCTNEEISCYLTKAILDGMNEISKDMGQRTTTATSYHKTFIECLQLRQCGKDVVPILDSLIRALEKSSEAAGGDEWSDWYIAMCLTRSDYSRPAGG